MWEGLQPAEDVQLGRSLAAQPPDRLRAAGGWPAAEGGGAERTSMSRAFPGFEGAAVGL